LLNENIIIDMENAFLNTSGTLGDKLMAAMQAAKVPGADVRCLSENVSSLSAFLRIAKVDDTNSSYGNLSIDLNIGATPDGVDPIDELQTAYDDLINITATIELNSKPVHIEIFPNPIPTNKNMFEISTNGIKLKKIRILNLRGEVVQNTDLDSSDNVAIQIDSPQSGIYIIEIHTNENGIHMKKLLVFR